MGQATIQQFVSELKVKKLVGVLLFLHQYFQFRAYYCKTCAPNIYYPCPPSHTRPLLPLSAYNCASYSKYGRFKMFIQDWTCTNLFSNYGFSELRFQQLSSSPGLVYLGRNWSSCVSLGFCNYFLDMTLLPLNSKKLKQHEQLRTLLLLTSITTECSYFLCKNLNVCRYSLVVLKNLYWLSLFEEKANLWWNIMKVICYNFSDVSTVQPNVMEVILECFMSGNEEVKSAAAYALGTLSSALQMRIISSILSTFRDVQKFMKREAR